MLQWSHSSIRGTLALTGFPQTLLVSGFKV